MKRAQALHPPCTTSTSINDTFGHDKGNDYIVGSCKIICNIFEHSPVYRIGGDEFVVVLRGQDYEHRNRLYKQITDTFKKIASDSTKQPWKRFSAAFGMAVFDPASDENAENVFKRADDKMYKNKVRMKAERR